MDTLWKDIRYGFRMLLKSPGFTVVAVISLALGIGANTAIFTLVDKALLRPLPVDEPERLVKVGTSTTRGVNTSFTYPDFSDYRDRNEVFEALVCYFQAPLSLNENGQTERIYGMMVSGNYFTALRMSMALGRGFTSEEDRTQGTHPVAVLSYGLWQRRFGADPTIINRSINLNGYDFTVIGVAPPEFTGTIRGFAPDAYLPMMMLAQAMPSWTHNPLESRNTYWLSVLARLKDGVSREQAEASMTTLGSQIAQAHPNPDGSVRSEPKFVLEDGSQGHNFLLRDLTFPLKVLMGVVGLVLLIACANVANLLLARASARRKEIAIRLAVGAGRRRLLRQLLTESVLLAFIGGVLGLALAAVMAKLLVSFTPPNNFTPLALDSDLDLRVLAFTVLLSLLTGVIFGLAPAFQASKPDLVPALKDEGATLASGPRRFTLRNLLVVAQVALSVVVLIAAGLCIRSLQKLQAIDAGFEPSKVLVMSLDLGLSGYNEARGQEFYSRIVEKVESLPGVEATSVARIVPLGGGGMSWTAGVEGYEPQPGENMNFDFNVVGPNYFRTIGTPLVYGREFTPQDGGSGPKVVIVNETIANRYWPGENPLGKRLRMGRPGPGSEPMMLEIVGVAKDSKYRDLTEETRRTMFLPVLQQYHSNMTLHVRTASDPRQVVSAVRREVQSLDASLPIYNVKTLAEQKSSSLYTARMTATLLGTFGLLALLLAGVGIYGVMAYSVNRRKREIGIRMALGAQRGDVMKLVLGEGAALIVAGLGVGLGATFAATRIISSVLYGVSATDPMTFVAISVLLTGVALAACFIPARRATKVDPMVVLRYE